MASHPVEQVQTASRIPKQEDETLQEYVRRVGETGETPAAVTEAAVEYVARWQYAKAPPENDAALERFLDHLVTDDATEADELGEDAAVPVPELEAVPEAQPLRAERRELRSAFKSGLRGREPRQLLLRFLGMVVTAPIIGGLIGRIWVPGTGLYDRAEGLLATALGISGVQAFELAGTFGLGAFAALLGLLLLDIKKRVQAMLLVVGSVLALGVMAAMGVFLPNVRVSWLNVVGVLGGMLVGLLVESERLLRIDWGASSFQRPTLDTGSMPEFRRAAWLLFGLVTTVVAGGLLQALLADAIGVLDVAAGIGFVLLSFGFIRYDSETSYMILGPARAGKSMLSLGLCLELLAGDGAHPNPNTYLQNGLERVSNLQPGNERWPIPSTPPDTLEVASFEVIAGYYFPRRLELTALDYAGQHLERVADLVAAGTGTDAGSVPAEVATEMTDGDTLLVLLDVERLVYPDKFQEAGVTDTANISWGLEHYTTILQAHDPDDVIVVATKCDILIDQRAVQAPTVHDSYAAFGDAVTDHLTDRPDVRELLEVAGETTINPVYFATKRREEATYVPRLDDAGNLMPVGFDHLLAELRRRQ